jgi:hypothetical protein
MKLKVELVDETTNKVLDRAEISGNSVYAVVENIKDYLDEYITLAKYRGERTTRENQGKEPNVE